MLTKLFVALVLFLVIGGTIAFSQIAGNSPEVIMNVTIFPSGGANVTSSTVFGHMVLGESLAGFSTDLNDRFGFFFTTDKIFANVTIANITLLIDYLSPTPSNATAQDSNLTTINFTVTNNSVIDTAGIEWNGTNFTVFGGGLIGLWHLNNDTLDYSGNGNDGTNNGANCSAVVDGQFGTACSFDGTNDFINIDTTLTNSLATTTQGTWMAWVKPVDATPAAGIEIFASFSDTSADEFIHMRINTNGVFRAKIKRAGTVQWQLDTDVSPFSDNIWTHIALVQNGTRPVIYIDGTAVAQTFSSSTDTTSWFNDLAGLDNGRIGDRNVNGGGESNSFDGDMDEVRIWNRALSADEINISYRSEIGQYFANITDNPNGTYQYRAWVNTTVGTNFTEFRTLRIGANFAQDCPNITTYIFNGSVYLSHFNVTFDCHVGEVDCEPIHQNSTPINHSTNRGILNITNTGSLNIFSIDFRLNETCSFINFTYSNTTNLSQHPKRTLDTTFRTLWGSLDVNDSFDFYIWANFTLPSGSCNPESRFEVN